MFCEKCGKQLADTARFCPACGAPVIPVVPMTPKPQQRTEAPAQPAPPAKPAQHAVFASQSVFPGIRPEPQEKAAPQQPVPPAPPAAFQGNAPSMQSQRMSGAVPPPPLTGGNPGAAPPPPPLTGGMPAAAPPPKKQGGKIAAVLIAVFLAMILLGTGGFFLIRHLIHGGEKFLDIPDRVTSELNTAAEFSDYIGLYSGKISFELKNENKLDLSDLTDDSIEKMKKSDGKTYDVTAELNNQTLIIRSPDAPLADAEGVIVRMPVDPEKLEDGILRKASKTEDENGRKKIQLNEIYFGEDEIYVYIADIEEEDNKVIGGFSSRTALDFDNPVPDSPEQDNDGQTDEEDPDDKPEQDGETSAPDSRPDPDVEPTVRFNEIPEDHIIFKNWSVQGVQDNPPKNFVFTLTGETYIEGIMNWHWNTTGPDEYKTATIALINNDTGDIYGPWKVQCDSAENGQNMGGWVVFPEISIPAGDYYVADSNRETWSYVPGDTADCGMTIIKGISKPAEESSQADTEDSEDPFTPDSEFRPDMYQFSYMKSEEDGEIFAEEVPADMLSEFYLVVYADKTGSLIMGGEESTLVFENGIVHATDPTGYQEDLTYEFDGDRLILKDMYGGILIFVK